MTTYRHSGLICTDHTLDVPLDHARPDGPAISLFAREVVAEAGFDALQFDEDPALVPLKDTAERLALRTDRPAPYDLDRLAANEVPVAAAVYHDDMFVDREQSRETAGLVRGLCKPGSPRPTPTTA